MEHRQYDGNNQAPTSTAALVAVVLAVFFVIIVSAAGIGQFIGAP